MTPRRITKPLLTDKPQPSSHAQEGRSCQALAQEPVKSSRKKGELEGNPGAGTLDLKEMKRLPPTQPCRNQMGCFKGLGERVIVRDFERQITELQIRV